VVATAFASRLNCPNRQVEPSIVASTTLSNCKDGDERNYPVVLLRGSAQGTTLSAVNDSWGTKERACEVPIVRGSFKVLVQLHPGENKIKLKAKSGELKIVLKYRPLPVVYKVNPIYLTADSGDTRYLTQFANDRQDFRAKLDMTIKLLQTFTAEQMHLAGHGYKTFAVDYDAAGAAPIHVLNMQHSTDSLRSLSEDDLYMKCLDRVAKEFPDQREKNLAVMAFTGYDSVLRKPTAHTALGGSALALFSCNGMCSWPSDIQGVAAAFNNTTPVDEGKIWNDTNGRPRLWALASTTIGVTLHELGHSFGLGHYDDRFSIMSRGFDYFNRHFVSTEPSAGGKVEDLLPGDNSARWNPEAASLLALSPWFQSLSTADSVQPNRALTVVNLDDGAERRYPIIVMRGTAPDGAAVKVSHARRLDEFFVQASVVDGKYKIVIPLLVGSNELVVSCGAESVRRTVKYKPLQTKHKVKLVYFVANDDETRYITQFDHDSQDFAERMRLSGRLLQTFCAESLHANGFGYRTFSLDCDDEDSPVVEVVRCSESAEALRNMGTVEVFEKLQEHLDEKFSGEHLRFIGIMGFTSYDAENQSPRGHTAIGSGRLSLFSSVGLCAWPSKVADVGSAFTDDTLIDRGRIFDDSNGRGRLWALASTTIGVSLHLLCKTWGLEGLGYDPFSIMSRGFDYFSRHFVAFEPVAGTSARLALVDSNSVRFDPQSAKRISECAWFQPD
jgi:hypothetical protein